MLQKVLQAILRRYFGQFLTGLQNVQLGFWAGKINIQNASFKHDKINQLIKNNHLPFSIKFSYIGSLQIDIPWKNLSSAAVQVQIKDIFIVLKLQGISFGQNNPNQNAKLTLIKNYTQYLIKKSLEMKMQNNSNQSGYLNRLIIKILHNMNLTIKNISIRIQNQGINTNQQNTNDFQSQSTKSINEKLQRKQSGLSSLSNSSINKKSKTLKISNKSFALGFCIDKFIAFTVDQKGQRRFINVDNQKAQFNKKIQLKQISLYWQQSLQQNLFGKTLQQKNKFLKSLINRKQHRLLAIDGNLFLRKNYKQQFSFSGLQKKQNRQFTYHLSSQFKQLSIGANYQQLKQMFLIYQTIMTNKQKHSIIKMKQLQNKEQLKLQNKFKSLFTNQLYIKKFTLTKQNQNQDKKQNDKIIQTLQLLNSLGKKLLLKWTKQLVIDIIKKQKHQNRLKQKNKKGWFSFLSNQQTQILLDQSQIKLIQQQIKTLIVLTEQKQIQSFLNKLFIQKLTLRIFQNLKSVNNQANFQQQIIIFFNNLNFQMLKYDRHKKFKIQVQKLGCQYLDYINNQKTSILQLRNNNKYNRVNQSDQFQSPTYYGLTLLFESFNINEQKRQIINFELQPIIIKHQIKVLSFISQLIKLKELHQQIQSDLILFKTQVQSSLPDQKIQLKGQYYQININIKKITIIIQISQNSYLKLYINRILIQKSEQNIYQHFMNISNFGVRYVNNSVSSYQFVGTVLGNQIEIISDVSFNVKIQGLKLIDCEIQIINVLFCQQDLKNIYKCLLNQMEIFKYRKKQLKKQKIIDQIFLQGRISIINTFRVKKTFLAVLFSDSLALYSANKNIQSLTQLFIMKQNINPSLRIPLAKLKITKTSEIQLKLQSLFVNQILEFQNQIQTNIWQSHINERIFQVRTKGQMYKLLDQENLAQNINKSQEKSRVKLIYQYNSEIVIKVKKIKILYSRDKQTDLLQFQCSKLKLSLKQNNFTYKRQIQLDKIQVINCQAPSTSIYGKLITNNIVDKKQFQFIQDKQNNSLYISLSGKKKLHPNYTGQLDIQINFKKLIVNFDAQFIYMIIDKIAWQKNYKPYNQQQRDKMVLKMFKQFLQNQQNKQLQQKITHSNQIDNNLYYADIDNFKKMFTCLILLNIKIKADYLSVNLINGRTQQVIFNSMLEKVQCNIDKGPNFLFIKVKTKSFLLDDLTGYPNTNKQKWNTKSQRYNLISTKTDKKAPYAVQYYFSSFPKESFVNKNRFKSFNFIKLNDISINYQHQPIMRFVDYLTNQLILFFMQPHSLHKFNQKVRGQFQYKKFYYRKDEIEEMIRNISLPFFSQLNINASNLTIFFNTFPNKQSIKFDIKKVTLSTENSSTSKRIQFNIPKLIEWQNKYPEFVQLSKNSTFQNKILKSQWSSRLIIKAQTISSIIFKNSFDYQMYFQRCMYQQKQFLLPCVKIKRDLIQQALIKNLCIVAPKKIYNLINKCFMYNLTYDDSLDKLFITNFENQHKDRVTQLSYTVRVHELSIFIPQLNDTVIIIEQMNYIFLRYPDLQKQMKVNGRALHILGQKNFIVPQPAKQQKGLQFIIQMKKSGQKVMSTFLRSTQIIYDLDLFNKLLQYFLLDQSCYPSQIFYPDLPKITWNFYCIESNIRVAKTLKHYYLLNGDIVFIWIRNSQPHPQNYKIDKRIFPIGKQGSLYIGKLKDCQLRKFQKNNYQSGKFLNYRVLSHPININMKWSNLMKLSQSGVQYNDFIVEYQIMNLFLKLSYVDIQDLNTALIKKNENSQSAVQQKPLGYVQFNQNIFKIDKITLQLGVSQLPVPLLDITLEGKSIIEMIDGTTTINFEIHNLTSKYWNMLIGRWQPILQKLSANTNIKISKKGGFYVIFDAPNIIYLDISMDSLKVLKLIADDFSNKGKLNIFKKQKIAQGSNVSPYVITNRTSLPIIISNPVIFPTKIQDGQKIHLQTQFLSNIDQFIGTILLKFVDQAKQYSLNLNISTIKKAKVFYKGIQYDLYLRPISSPIVKQIIITSPYVLSNQTSYKFFMTFYNKVYALNPQEKIAIPFYELIENKLFKIQFPHLENINQNYAFQFKDLHKGYQHYIYTQKQQFNCAISLKQETNQSQIQIQVTPIYQFKNLLPLEVFLEFNIKSKNSYQLLPIILKTNEKKQVYELNIIEDVFIRVKIKGYHFSEFKQLSKSLDATFQPHILPLHDHRTFQGKIKIKILQIGKMRKVYLYTDAVLINQTMYDLYLFNESQLLSGQKVSKIAESSTKYTFLYPEQHRFLNLGLSDDDPFRSNQFGSTQLGNQQISMLKSDQYYQLIVNNTLNCIDNEAQIYCNIIKLMPKYIMINESSRLLQIKQFNTEKIVHLMPSQRVQWIWKQNNQKHEFCFRPIDNQIEQEILDWEFSSGLDIDQLEDTVIIIKRFNKSQYSKLLIKLQIHKENLQIFIVFKEVINQQENNFIQEFYTFHNELKLAKIQFYQCTREFSRNQIQQQQIQDTLPFKANPGEKIIFGWQNSQNQQILYVKLQFLGPLKSKFKKQEFIINTNKKQTIKKLINNSDGEQYQIQFVIEITGFKKKIKVRQVNNMDNDSQFLRAAAGGNKIGISLHQLGISVISSSKNRKQILYLSFKKFQIILMEEHQIRKIQVKIKYFSIDNNSHHNTIYPVLLTPLKHEKTLTKSRPFFVMLIQTNINKDNITEIKQFRICLQSISLKIHDQVLILLYDMYKDISVEEKSNNNSDLNKLFLSLNQKYQWQQRQLKKSENQIFFREFQIAKLSIQLSFSIRPKYNRSNFIIFTILSSFGLAISNISQSQLTLSRFLKKEVSLTQLKNEISQFYVKQIIKGIYKILGSITIFGNPYVFIRLLAQGAWEIVNQPTQGFIKGPIQGTIGIAKGGIYFTRNIIAGTFNSFESISQSLSRGISYMTMDQKFIQRRQKIKIQKSNHLIQGFRNGLFAFYTGFQVAVTGLVRHPVQGYKKDGIGSGITGALKGIAGLVTKPISGIFQGVSKFSQGIKNTALLFQDGPNNKRARHPRVFLSHQKYYTNYNHLESYTIAFLQHLSTKYLNMEVLFLSVTENIQESIMKSLVLSDKHLLIVDLVLKKVQIQYGLNEIQMIELQNQTTVRITTKKDEQIEIQEQPKKCQQLLHAFKELKSFLQTVKFQSS